MKRRTPETIEAALVQAMAAIGLSTMSEELGRSEAIIRQWADPDAEKYIQHRHSIAIDIACARAGEGTPMLTAHRRMVEAGVRDHNTFWPENPVVPVMALSSIVGEINRVIGNGDINGPELLTLVANARARLDEIEALAERPRPKVVAGDG